MKPFVWNLDVFTLLFKLKVLECVIFIIKKSFDFFIKICGMVITTYILFYRVLGSNLVKLKIKWKQVHLKTTYFYKKINQNFKLNYFENYKLQTLLYTLHLMEWKTSWKKKSFGYSQLKGILTINNNNNNRKYKHRWFEINHA